MARMNVLKRLLSRKFDSGGYWRRRYEKKQTSGPRSYGRLAAYKAEVVNTVCKVRNIASVIEFGCGDGNQTALFEISRYAGIDISPLIIDRARRTFADRPDWTFQIADQYTGNPGAYDMSMSLDVIYHLVEDNVFDAYMHQLVVSSQRYVLIYASDHDEITKDVHVRHRHYSRWLAQHYPDLNCVETLQHPYPAAADTDASDTSFAFFQLFEKDRKHSGSSLS